tara:strand:+ start:86 stop:511 length:426 start_codon:yes stop_codon:yes gene_type:complete
MAPDKKTRRRSLSSARAATNALKTSLPMNMKFLNRKSMCEPAMLYLLVGVIGIVGILVQNLVNGDDGTFCVGNYECDMINKTTGLILQLIYVLFWTWLLNTLCKRGYVNVSWVIVLFPFLLYIGIISALVSSDILYVIVDN